MERFIYGVDRSVLRGYRAKKGVGGYIYLYRYLSLIVEVFMAKFKHILCKYVSNMEKGGKDRIGEWKGLYSSMYMGKWW